MSTLDRWAQVCRYRPGAGDGGYPAAGKWGEVPSGHGQVHLPTTAWRRGTPRPFLLSKPIDFTSLELPSPRRSIVCSEWPEKIRTPSEASRTRTLVGW